MADPRTPAAASIIPGAIYTEDDLKAAANAGRECIDHWLSLGLTFRREGTKGRLFVADEVIAFVKKLPKKRKGDGPVEKGKSGDVLV